MRALSATRCDIDLLDYTFRFRPGEVYAKQPMDEIGALNLHAFGQQERALKLTRSYPPVEKHAFLVVLLSASNDKLSLFQSDFQLVLGKSRNSKRDPEPFGRAFRLGQALDVVRRINVRCVAGYAVEGAFDIVKAQ